MNRTPKRVLSPRVPDSIIEWYAGNFSSATAGGEYILTMVPALHRRALHGLKGRFIQEELCLILDASNGLFLTPGLAGQHIGLTVADAMAIDGLDGKWSVARDALNAKVSGLNLLEAACLEIWGRAYWESGAYEAEGAMQAYIEGLL